MATLTPLARASRAEQPSFTSGEERDAAFIDALIQVAEDRRTEAFGPNYYEWAKQFFLFRPEFWQPQLEYQIKLRMADLQTLVIQEASDLTDSEPNFFISRHGKRVQEREDAFHANWRSNHFGSEIFYAQIWAMTAHTGFVEFYTDPAPPRHSVKIRCRNPQGVYPDPFSTEWRDWEYVIVRVPMAPDEIVRQFPWTADRLPGLLAEYQRELNAESRLGGVIGSGPMAIELPPGAMQSVAIGRPPGATDYLSVDYCYIKDETRESVAREVAGSKAAGGVLPPPDEQPKYPSGRLIVRTGKLKLWDAPNRYRRFPLVPVFGMPPIYGVWGTPPIQYLIQLQHLAESMYSQNAENAIRLNYGYRVYADGQILNPESLDKLGASIRVKTGDDVAKAFRIIPPTPFSSQQTAMPMELMGHMRQLFGYTPEREGKVGAGNISPGLMDAAVSNAQGITRMRARLLAESVEELGRAVLETMVDHLDDSEFRESLDGDLRTAPWTGVPLDQLGGWEATLDAASMKPMSSSALRNLVPVLANLGWLTPRYGLDWLGVPHARDIAADLEKQKQQELLAIASGQMQQKSKGRGRK